MLRLPCLGSSEVGCIGFSQLALPNARTWNPTARPLREKFIDPGRTASILIASGVRQPARTTTVAAAPGALTGCSVTVSSAWGGWPGGTSIESRCEGVECVFDLHEISRTNAKECMRFPLWEAGLDAGRAPHRGKNRSSIALSDHGTKTTFPNGRSSWR